MEPKRRAGYLISRYKTIRRRSVIQQKDFVQFINENKTGMYRFAYGILKNEADAEDAVSEAIIKDYENLYKLRNADKMKVWMMTILSNEAKKIYGKNKRYASEELMPEIIVTEKKDCELWDVVKSLPPNFSKVIILYYYEGFSTKEIAQILKIAEGTVKSRLSRAMMMLLLEMLRAYLLRRVFFISFQEKCL